MRSALAVWSFAVCVVAVGCAVQAPPPMFDSHVAPDSTSNADASTDGGGHDGALDAGMDAAMAVDAGEDAFVADDAASVNDAGMDAFVAPDAFTPPDAFVAPDAFTPPDAFVAPDAFTPPDAFVAPDAFTPPDAWVPECAAPTDCTGTDDECSMRTCLSGVCGRSYTASGTPIAAQTPGDCLSVVCDGAGGTTSVTASDPMDDGNACTTDTCSGGTTTHPFSSAGTVCPTGRCDGAGTCVAIPSGLVVVRVGDGSAALSSAATAVFLEHRSFAGALGAIVPMPTAASGANQPLTLAGSSPIEGALTRSADGHYVMIAGYAAAPGTAAVAGTSAATVHRVAGRIDASDAVDTTTHAAVFSGSSVRSAATADGMRVWMAGGANGVQTLAFGTSTATQVLAMPANGHVVAIFGGQLYETSGSVPFDNVFTVGTGLPTTTGSTATSLPGMPVTTGPSPEGFLLFDASAGVAGLDLLYVADDRGAAGGGGVQRWTFDGTTWTLGATFNLGNGAVGVAAYRVGSLTYLYATTTNGRIVEIVDDGASTPTPSTIATAGTNTSFRGIALAPF